MSIPEFYQRFPTEAACGEFIAQERWGGKTHCPHSKGDKIYQV